MTFQELEREVWEDRIRVGVDKRKAPGAVLSARPPLGPFLPASFRTACRIALLLGLLSLAWGLYELYQVLYAYAFLGFVFWGLLSTMMERLAVRRLRSLAVSDEEFLVKGIAAGVIRLARRRPDGGFEPVRYP